MQNYPKRLGEALVDSGIIDRKQLMEGLKLQEEQPFCSFGDIIAARFQIPRETIEDVFINDALKPAIEKVMIDNLKKEETKFTASLPIKANQLEYDIQVSRIRLKRTHTKSFEQDEQGKLSVNPHYSIASTDIDGFLKIIIRTTEGDVVCEEDNLEFVYEFEKRKVELMGHFIDSLRFHFSRKNKEILGISIGCNPLTEQELKEVLAHF